MPQGLRQVPDPEHSNSKVFGEVSSQQRSVDERGFSGGVRRFLLSGKLLLGQSAAEAAMLQSISVARQNLWNIIVLRGLLGDSFSLAVYSVVYW